MTYHESKALDLFPAALACIARYQAGWQPTPDGWARVVRGQGDFDHVEHEPMTDAETAVLDMAGDQ